MPAHHHDRWQRLQAQLQDLDANIALLQTNELPAAVVTALETPLSSADTHGIIALLTEMIAVKWRLGGLVEPNARHMVDVAHDWAVDTLLDLPTPPAPSVHAASVPRRMGRDAMAAITAALQQPTLRPLDARDVLETAAELLARDEPEPA
ncbi:hypothetical protein ATCC90586_003926 [Pythium insidiosum]|nr:hypothetical protein ATCC90586_003926 [Pythium insidiosum]